MSGYADDHRSRIPSDYATAPDGLALRFPEASPFLSRSQVLELVPVSYACLWGWMRDGFFPQAREIGPTGRRNRIGWLKKEVEEWLVNRPVRVQRKQEVEVEGPEVMPELTRPLKKARARKNSEVA